MMKRFLPLALIAGTLGPLPLQAQETAEERTDRGLIVGFLEDNLSSAGRQITLRGFEGALSSRATATQLTIADDQGVWLTLNDIVLDWNRSALFGGRVEVSELIAGEIIVARAPISAAEDAVPSPEAKGFSLPDLPVSVQISKVSAPRVVLGESLIGQPVEGSVEASLMLSGGEGSGKLLIERKDTGPDGRIDLTAAYSNSTNVLQVDLTAVEAAQGIAATMMNLPGLPSVDLRLTGRGPLDDFNAELALKTDSTERLRGDLALRGTQDGASQFSANISGDMAPLFLPQYADFLGNQLVVKVDGVKQADGVLDLQTLDLKARSLALQGKVQLAADGLPRLIDLNGTLRDPDDKSVVIPGAEGVTLRTGQMSVSFDEAKGESWTAVIEADDVDTAAFAAEKLDLRGTGRIAREASGRLVDGNFIAQTYGLKARDPAVAQALGDAAQASADFRWQEQTGRLQISKLTLAAGPIKATGDAEIFGFDDNLRIKAKSQIFAADLAPLSALAGQKLSGKANLTVTAEGSPLAGDFDVQAQVSGQDLGADIAEVDNLLKGMSTVSLDVKRDDKGTTLRALQLRATGLEVDGTGQIDSTNTALNLTLAMDNVSRLGGTYGGAVAGKVVLNGPLTEGRARLSADLNTTDLRIGIPEADQMLAGKAQLSLLGDLDGQSMQVERLNLTAPSGAVDLTGRLSLEDSNVSAKVSLADLSRLGPGYGGALAAEGSFIGSPENATITVKADAKGLRVGQEQADKLLSGATQLSGNLRLENGAIRVDSLKLNNPQLTVDATGKMQEGVRDVQLSARLANLGLILPEFPGAVTLSGTAVDRGNGYELALQGTGPGQINARVNGSVASNFSSANISLQGSAQAGLANPFLGTRVVNGPVTMDLRLNGPLALSSLSGQLRLAQGRLVDPSLPFALEGIDITAALGSNRVSLKGTTQISTGGLISILGPIELTAPYNADLAIGIQNAVVRDPQLYQTRASGNLRVAGPLTGGAVISGQINLLETEIRVASSGVSAQELIAGLRHVGDTTAVRETRRRAQIDASDKASATTSGGGGYGLDVDILAPNQLFIRGRGLDAELGGTLHIAGTTENIIPSGGFELIRGRLDILGRRLDLTEASLQLEGDFDARLRIVATSVNDNISSSVVIQGSASDPQVSFTSQPELPQEEVLAQLLFGRRLDNISALQALQLANAVATLAGKGGEGMISKLRQGFGLDDLDVQTDSAGNAQLKAGKYLSENVYSEVTVDQQGRSQINLNLDVTDNITVKGKVGADGDTGLGIFYQRDY